MRTLSSRKRRRGYALLLALMLTALVLGTTALVFQRTSLAQGAAKQALQQAMVKSALQSAQHTGRLLALRALWPAEAAHPLAVLLGEVSLVHTVRVESPDRVMVDSVARASGVGAPVGRSTLCFQRLEVTPLMPGCLAIQPGVAP